MNETRTLPKTCSASWILCGVCEETQDSHFDSAAVDGKASRFTEYSTNCHQLLTKGGLGLGFAKNTELKNRDFALVMVCRAY
jgi:hypothetical protein